MIKIKLASRILILVPALLLFLGEGRAAQNKSASDGLEKCEIEISQVLNSRIDRGPPYLVQQLMSDPGHAEQIQGESHGDHHLLCEYKIALNSVPYSFKQEISNTMLQLQESYCRTPEAKKKAKDEILLTTERCKNPLARPRLGNALEALP